MADGISSTPYELVEKHIPDLEELHYHRDSDSHVYLDFGRILKKFSNLKVITIYEIDDTILDTLAQMNSVQELLVLGTYALYVRRTYAIIPN